MEYLPGELLFIIGLELPLKDLSSLRQTCSHYNRIFMDSCYWKRRAQRYLVVCSAPIIAWRADPIGTFQQLLEANDNIRRSYSVLRKQLKLLEEREILVSNRIDNLRDRCRRVNCALLALDN